MRRGGVGALSLSDHQCADVPLRGPVHEPSAGIDGYWIPRVIQPDPSAKERLNAHITPRFVHILTDAHAKEGGILKKELSAFRKENREAGYIIHLPVRIGLCEIGIECEVQDGIRIYSPFHFTASFHIR